METNDTLKFDETGKILVKCLEKVTGEVVIPNSVNKIGTDAFRWCNGLTSIVIPNSVTEIESCAFLGCSGLTSIKIPNSVTSIKDGTFRECFGLISVSIPNSITSIGNMAFYACSSLTSIEIPNSVTSIGEYAFSSCYRLASVTIPNSVTSIKNNAFYGCGRLASVIVQWVNPLACSDIFGEKSKKNCTLHVPAGTLSEYLSVQAWTGFHSIVEIGSKEEEEDAAEREKEKDEEKGLKGDVNEDGVVDVADITSVAHIILYGNAKEEYNIEDKIRILETMKFNNVITEDEFDKIREVLIQ